MHGHDAVTAQRMDAGARGREGRECVEGEGERKERRKERRNNRNGGVREWNKAARKRWFLLVAMPCHTRRDARKLNV